MTQSRDKTADETPARDKFSNSSPDAGEASIPSTLDDDVSIDQFTQGNLGEDIQGLPEESIAAEREASLNKDEPDLDLDRLDPVPPK